MREKRAAMSMRGGSSIYMSASVCAIYVYIYIYISFVCRVCVCERVGQWEAAPAPAGPWLRLLVLVLARRFSCLRGRPVEWDAGRSLEGVHSS